MASVAGTGEDNIVRDQIQKAEEKHKELKERLSKTQAELEGIQEKHRRHLKGATKSLIAKTEKTIDRLRIAIQDSVQEIDAQNHKLRTLQVNAESPTAALSKSPTPNPSDHQVGNSEYVKPSTASGREHQVSRVHVEPLFLKASSSLDLDSTSSSAVEQEEATPSNGHLTGRDSVETEGSNCPTSEDSEPKTGFGHVSSAEPTNPAPLVVNAAATTLEHIPWPTLTTKSQAGGVTTCDNPKTNTDTKEPDAPPKSSSPSRVDTATSDIEPSSPIYSAETPQKNVNDYSMNDHTDLPVSGSTSSPITKPVPLPHVPTATLSPPPMDDEACLATPDENMSVRKHKCKRKPSSSPSLSLPPSSIPSLPLPTSSIPSENSPPGDLSHPASHNVKQRERDPDSYAHKRNDDQRLYRVLQRQKERMCSMKRGQGKLSALARKRKSPGHVQKQVDMLTRGPRKEVSRNAEGGEDGRKQQRIQPRGGKEGEHAPPEDVDMGEGPKSAAEGPNERGDMTEEEDSDVGGSAKAGGQEFPIEINSESESDPQLGDAAAAAEVDDDELDDGYASSVGSMKLINDSDLEEMETYTRKGQWQRVMAKAQHKPNQNRSGTRRPSPSQGTMNKHQQITAEQCVIAKKRENVALPRAVVKKEEGDEEAMGVLEPSAEDEMGLQDLAPGGLAEESGDSLNTKNGKGKQLTPRQRWDALTAVEKLDWTVNGKDAIEKFRKNKAPIPTQLRTFMREIAEFCPEAAWTSRSLTLHCLTTTFANASCLYHIRTYTSSHVNDMSDNSARPYKLTGVPWPRALNPRVPKSKAASTIEPPKGALHCGCYEDHALWDFFFWKAGVLHSPTLGISEGWMGTRLDPRTRGLIVSVVEKLTCSTVDVLYRAGPHLDEDVVKIKWWELIQENLYHATLKAQGNFEPATTSDTQSPPPTTRDAQCLPATTNDARTSTTTRGARPQGRSKKLNALQLARKKLQQKIKVAATRPHSKSKLFR